MKFFRLDSDWPTSNIVTTIRDVGTRDTVVVYLCLLCEVARQYDGDPDIVWALNARSLALASGLRVDYIEQHLASIASAIGLLYGSSAIDLEFKGPIIKLRCPILMESQKKFDIQYYTRPDQKILNQNIPETNSSRTFKKERKPSASSKKITFDFGTGKLSGYEEFLDKWKESYPAADVEHEILRMEQWQVANPDKIKKNYYKFIVNWLSRVQDKPQFVREPLKTFKQLDEEREAERKAREREEAIRKMDERNAEQLRREREMYGEEAGDDSFEGF